MITVAMLIAQLQQLDQDRVVVLSADSEGNNFYPLGDTSTDMDFFRDDGEIRYPKLTPELQEQGYGLGDCRSGGKPCLVLWPE